MTAALATGSEGAATRGMSSPSETFGARIRRLRKQRFPTQLAMAHALGVTEPCVSQWENDVVQPRQYLQRALAGLLGVSLHYLIYGEEDTHIAILYRAIRMRAPYEHLAALIGPVDE